MRSVADRLEAALVAYTTRRKFREHTEGENERDTKYNRKRDPEAYWANKNRYRNSVTADEGKGNTPWTLDEIAALGLYHAEGIPIRIIAAAIGRSYFAVERKLRRLK